MPEGYQAVAVDVCDRADGRPVGVTADELHTDGRAGLEFYVRTGRSRLRACGPRHRSHARTEEPRGRTKELVARARDHERGGERR